MRSTLALSKLPSGSAAVSAVAATGYLVMIALAMWSRYSYLLELRRVVTYGPSYDPVTRMRSHAETGQMVGEVFYRATPEDEAATHGLIVISISNLYGLEKLHGRAAVNHALYMCATRIRRCVSGAVETGRLGEDGFLLLVRNLKDWSQIFSQFGLGAAAIQTLRN